MSQLFWKHCDHKGATILWGQKPVRTSANIGSSISCSTLGQCHRWRVSVFHGFSHKVNSNRNSFFFFLQTSWFLQDFQYHTEWVSQDSFPQNQRIVFLAVVLFIHVELNCSVIEASAVVLSTSIVKLHCNFLVVLKGAVFFVLKYMISRCRTKKCMCLSRM